MNRKRPQKSLSVEKIIERRNLEWVPLAPPDYSIDPEFLIDKFVEREIYYFGTISSILNDIDMTKRNDVIGIIDVGFKSQNLIHISTPTIISISAQNVKFNKRNIPENLILRIPLEQIKSVAYIKDDLIHYIVILHGNQSNRDSILNLNLTVISAESRNKAEEICSLINQCFQIIYTEATIKHFDRQVNKVRDKNIDKNLYNQENKPSNRKLIPKSSKDLNDLDSINSDLSSSKVDFLQNFMIQLKNVLNKDELTQFAEFLLAWQQGAPFEIFCNHLQNLLGPKRISILANMKSFVDPADWFILDQYLNDFSPQSKSCSPMTNWSQMIGKSPITAFHTQRSLSYASTSNGVLSIYDEENSFRDDISSPIKNLYTSKRFTDKKENTEFSQAMNNLFNKVGDLELILSKNK